MKSRLYIPSFQSATARADDSRPGLVLDAVSDRLPTGTAAMRRVGAGRSSEPKRELIIGNQKGRKASLLTRQRPKSGRGAGGTQDWSMGRTFAVDAKPVSRDKSRGDGHALRETAFPLSTLRLHERRRIDE